MTMGGNASQKVWLVTGCSSGLGRSFVRAIVARGDIAVATARDPETLRLLQAQHPGQVMPLALDVTRRDQIQQVVAHVIGTLGRIDGLINNAGYGYRAAVEEGTPEEVDRLFQTNFFGPVALIQAVLPHMRRQRAGAIVNISSIAAVNTFPGSGYYGASKCALEGLPSALEKEVAPLGIQVMVVEPGAFRTDFSGRSLRQAEKAIADYAETAGRRRIEHDHSHGTQPGDPDQGARLVLEALRGPQPPFRLVLGAGFDGPPSGTPLGGHPGPDSAADRSAGAPRCPVGLAFAWPGGGGVWGVCVLVPPASAVPVRPGPLCLFRRGPAGGGVLPGLSGHPGAVRLAGPLRRKGAAGPGPAEKAAGVGPLGEKTAEPLGSAVMPVSDLFACR